MNPCKIYSLCLSIIFFVSASKAQSFEASVSSDSVLIGNHIILEFSLENVDGKFEAPNLEGFEILSGPNSSSSVRILNGQQSSSKSYSYYVKPKDLGLIVIDPAYLVSEDSTMETQAIEISVYPNPNGTITEPKKENDFDFFNFDFSFPELELPQEKNRDLETPSKKSSKRKLKKI